VPPALEDQQAEPMPMHFVVERRPELLGIDP
jgi:hypothetical protein